MFSCELCLYETNKSSNLKQHFNSKKHQFNVKSGEQIEMNICTIIDKPKSTTSVEITDDENKSIKKKNVKKKIKKKTKITRQKMPASLKLLVWDRWIGLEIGKAKCLCCKNMDIFQGSFECGHIIAISRNGKTIVENLKPICKTCNSSMNNQNMDDFMKQWNFEITEPVKNTTNDKLNINAFDAIKNIIIETSNSILQHLYAGIAKSEEVIVDGETRFKCEHCKKTYNARKNLLRHQNDTICKSLIENKVNKNHEEILKLIKKLDEIPEKLIKIDNVNKHLIKNQNCENDCKQIITIDNIVQNIPQNNDIESTTTINSDKKFSCENCDKCYSSANNLSKHKSYTICGAILRKKAKESRDHEIIIALKKQIDDLSTQLIVANKIIIELTHNTEETQNKEKKPTKKKPIAIKNK